MEETFTTRVRAEQQVRALTIELTTAEQEERRRISQILHDDLQQRIFAVKMKLGLMGEAFEKKDLQDIEVDFSQLDEWLAEGIRITRQLSIDLSPLTLQGERLADAMAWLSSQMLGQYGLEVKLESDDIQSNLDNNLRVILFRATRELLFNVVKHAEVLQAVITLKQIDKDRVRIIVSDEGKGFDPEIVMNDQTIAHGLINIRRQLDLFGCSVEVKSEIGGGTRVSIDAPVRLPGSNWSPDSTN